MTGRIRQSSSSKKSRNGSNSSRQAAEALGDTKRNPRYLDSLLRRVDLSDRDAIIGPLIPDNISVLSKNLKSADTPIFLPVTNYDNASSNVFNTIPQNELKAETKAAWKQKALKAGIGIIAPAPKAAIIERSIHRR